MLETINTAVGRFYKTPLGLCPSITTVTGKTEPLNEGLRSFLLDHTREEVEKIFKDAGTRGTRVHVSVECLIKHKALSTKGLTADEAKMVMGFANWWAEADYEHIASEETTYLPDERYLTAGRYDHKGKLNGKLTVIDIKTSKEVYFSHLMQLAFYATCEGAEQALILQLKYSTKKGYQPHLLKKKDIELYFEMFKSCRHMYEILGYPTTPPKEEIIPEFIELKKGETDATKCEF